MDALLGSMGIQRDMGETLTRFADRLEQSGNDEITFPASKWYREYAASRYDPTRKSEADAAGLQDQLETIESATTEASASLKE